MDGQDSASAKDDTGKEATASTSKLTSAKLTPEAGIPIKTEDDEKDCYVSGLAVLSDDKLLITDWHNYSVKLVDTQSNTVVSVLEVSGCPWDVAILPEDEAAVTLTSLQLIQVIFAGEHLFRAREIKVKGQCRGICSAKNKLVVSFDAPTKIEIMDYYGYVFRMINKDTIDSSLFDYFPYYVAVGSEEGREVIYVSDCFTNTVTKLSMTGQVLLAYTDEDLKSPRGLAVSSEGELLACSSSSSTCQIQLVSPDGSKIRRLLGEDDGLFRPCALCIATNNSKLFVSSNDSEEIKVYSIT